MVASTTGEGLGETIPFVPAVDSDAEADWTVAISCFVPVQSDGSRFLASDHQRVAILRRLRGHSASFHVAGDLAEFTLSLTAPPRRAVSLALELCWAALEDVGVDRTEAVRLWLIEHAEFDAAVAEHRSIAYDSRTPEAVGHDSLRREIADLVDVGPFLIGDSVPELLARLEGDFGAKAFEDPDSSSGSGKGAVAASPDGIAPIDRYQSRLAQALSQALDIPFDGEESEQLASRLIPVIISEVFGDGRGLATQSSLADVMGISKQRVHQLSASADFPAPLMRIAGDRPVWLISDVEAWNRDRLGVADAPAAKGDLTSLEGAVADARLAVDLTPGDSSDLPGYLNNLADRLAQLHRT